MIPNNACHLRLTAAAGTKLAVTSSGLDQCTEVHFLTPDSSLHPEGLPPTRGVAVSGFRPLHNIRYCSPPWRSGQCLSPDVAGQPLSPATRRCLGEPLPHQQADRPQVPPQAPRLLAAFTPGHFTPESYSVLGQISREYPNPEGRLPTCYSPVRH